MGCQDFYILKANLGPSCLCLTLLPKDDDVSCQVTPPEATYPEYDLNRPSLTSVTRQKLYKPLGHSPRRGAHFPIRSYGGGVYLKDSCCGTPPQHIGEISTTNFRIPIRFSNTSSAIKQLNIIFFLSEIRTLPNSSVKTIPQLFHKIPRLDIFYPQKYQPETTLEACGHLHPI